MILSPQSRDRRALMTFSFECVISLLYCVFVLYHGPTWYCWGFASSSFCLYLVRPFSFPSRGSHYCGGQSRAGASTLSHTPGRTNRKTQWHVTVLLSSRFVSDDSTNSDVRVQTRTQTNDCIIYYNDECMNEFRRQWRRRPRRPRPYAPTVNGSLIFI